MTAAVRPVRSHAELLDASGDDAFIRWQVPADAPLDAWVVGDAVAFVRTRSTGRRQLTVLGAPEQAAAAVHTLLRLSVTHVPSEDLLGGSGSATATVAGGSTGRSSGPTAATGHGITVPRGTLDLLDERIRVGPGDDWDWMWVDRERLACVTLDARVRRLGAQEEVDVARLLALASPRHSSDPGDPDVVDWFGIRDVRGELVACAAHTQSVEGVPHLASIATHPAVRGHGLGAAITGTVTARLLDAGAPAVTLGMYADNDVARRMYDRLGYVTAHRWSSRAVVVRPGGPLRARTRPTGSPAGVDGGRERASRPGTPAESGDLG